MSDRKVDKAYIQETQWRGSGCKFYGTKGKRYKLFWIGGEEESDGVGIFIAIISQLTVHRQVAASKRMVTSTVTRLPLIRLDCPVRRSLSCDTFTVADWGFLSVWTEKCDDTGTVQLKQN